jgi:hypothetical protein
MAMFVPLPASGGRSDIVRLSHETFPDTRRFPFKTATAWRHRQQTVTGNDHNFADVYFPSSVLTGSQSGPGGLLVNAFARPRNSADGLSISAARAKQFAAA